MRKATRNYILALILCLLGLFELVSSFILWRVLPIGGEGYMGGTFLWERHIWIDVHGWVGVALVVVVVIHVILHWKWIVYMTKTLGGQKE